MASTCGMYGTRFTDKSSVRTKTMFGLAERGVGFTTCLLECVHAATRPTAASNTPRIAKAWKRRIYASLAHATEKLGPGRSGRPQLGADCLDRVDDLAKHVGDLEVLGREHARDACL